MDIKHHELPDVDVLIANMARDLKSECSRRELDEPVMIGIHTGGVWVAERLHKLMDISAPLGVLDISSSIIAESTLSFLGLGDPTLISWGMMLNFAFERAISRMAWWFLLPPGFAIVWVSLAIILIGNALEEIVDPRLSTHHLFNPRHMVSLRKGKPPLREAESGPEGAS